MDDFSSLLEEARKSKEHQEIIEEAAKRAWDNTGVDWKVISTPSKSPYILPLEKVYGFSVEELNELSSTLSKLNMTMPELLETLKEIEENERRL